MNDDPQMVTVPMAVLVARHALSCLYIAVDETVAEDVRLKVEAAFTALASPPAWPPGREEIRGWIADGISDALAGGDVDDIADAATEAIIALRPAPDGWRTMESAPHDDFIWVYADIDQQKLAPEVRPLEPIICICRWHDEAGFCVDELREPRLWQPAILPAPPETPK